MDSYRDRFEATEEDLIAALFAAQQQEPEPGRPPGFLRRVELEAALGVPAQKVYDMLHALNHQGRLVCRRVTVRSELTGERITVQAYGLKEVRDDTSDSSDDSGDRHQRPD